MVEFNWGNFRHVHFRQKLITMSMLAWKKFDITLQYVKTITRVTFYSHLFKVRGWCNQSIILFDQLIILFISKISVHS